MKWYKRWFGEEYLLVYEHRNIKEAERNVKAISRLLGLKENELVLDLCCGSGRHDIQLVKLGCRVIGLDLSGPLLKIAKSVKPPDNGYLQYIMADAKKIPLKDGIFDVVLNLFTSFGYFEDDDNPGMLCSIARLLKPGGRFLIDYLNPPFVLAGLVPESTKEKNGLIITEKRNFNAATIRIEKTILLSGDGQTGEFHESVRLYERDEMLEMLSDAGLYTEGVLGSVEGEPYSDSSGRMILYGVKSHDSLD